MLLNMYNILIISFVLLLLYFLIGKSGFMNPSRLSLRNRKSELASPSQSGYSTMTPSKESVQASREAVGATVHQIKERSLNVMFMYNGHSFDAFEILGLPAGCSYKKAKVQFDGEVSLGQSDYELKSLALDAIKKSQGL
jgi:hypothetical protein